MAGSTPRGASTGQPGPEPLGPVLVLATSGLAAEVGLRREAAGALAVRALGAGAARGRGLLPAIEALLREAGLAPRDIGAIAADIGPGSFTGVRVGVTAAKSLAWALSVPVVGVRSLDALARAAPPETEVLAVRDAGRGTVYAALFGPAQGGVRPVRRAPARLDGAGLQTWSPTALLVGEEAPRLATAFGLPQRALAAVADAAAVLAEALPLLQRGGAGDPSTLVPLYLQASAPERLAAGEPAGPHPRGPGDRSSAP